MSRSKASVMLWMPDPWRGFRRCNIEYTFSLMPDRQYSLHRVTVVQGGTEIDCSDNSKQLEAIYQLNRWQDIEEQIVKPEDPKPIKPSVTKTSSKGFKIKPLNKGTML